MRIPRNAAQLAQRERSSDEHEGQETQKDRPPPDVIGDKCGKRRTRDAGHDPGRREDREHARPESVRIRTADDDVRDGGYGAGPKPLDGTCPDEDRHRRCEPSDQQADREQPETGAEGDRGAEAIGELTGDDDPDEVRQKERAEDPSVEGDAAEIRDDERHDRRDREGFERHERHVENETRGEAAPPLVQ